MSDDLITHLDRRAAQRDAERAVLNAALAWREGWPRGISRYLDQQLIKAVDALCPPVVAGVEPLTKTEVLSGHPKCERPEPGTIGAEAHCWHWHNAEDDELPCCWCGSTEDDSGSCPAVRS